MLFIQLNTKAEIIRKAIATELMLWEGPADLDDIIEAIQFTGNVKVNDNSVWFEFSMPDGSAELAMWYDGSEEDGALLARSAEDF